MTSISLSIPDIRTHPYLYLRSLHSVVGDPIYPSGQVQTGSCPKTLQFALGAQGLSKAQGLIHAEFRHAA